jgi:hypothetical protein
VLISQAQVVWIGALLLLAWIEPNTREIMARTQAFIAATPARAITPALTWRIDRGWAVATALLLVVALVSLSGVSEFLYFQF